MPYRQPLHEGARRPRAAAIVDRVGGHVFANKGPLVSNIADRWSFASFFLRSVAHLNTVPSTSYILAGIDIKESP
jgi:hypothetical protein